MRSVTTLSSGIPMTSRRLSLYERYRIYALNKSYYTIQSGLFPLSSHLATSVPLAYERFLMVLAMIIGCSGPTKKPAFAGFLLTHQLCHPRNQRTGIPAAAPSSASNRARPPPSKPAERIMPSLMPKRILRGARLAMKTTLRPTSFSGSP